MLGGMKPITDGRAAELIEQGWWTGVTWPGLLDRAVASNPDATALIDAANGSMFMDGEPRAVTWAHLDEEVRRAGAVLYSLGVGRGDVVGIQLPNCLWPCSRLHTASTGTKES